MSIETVIAALNAAKVRYLREPFEFEAAWARAVRVPLDEAIATFASIDDLVALKRAAGRPVDLEGRRGAGAARGEAPVNDRDDAGFPNGFEAHRRAQRARIGADMTPAERLRWLEETMDALRRWCGRARLASAPPGPGGTEE